MIIPYPKLGQIGEQAVNGNPCAQLLWIALAQLSTKEGYAELTPQEGYEKLKKIALEIYK